jgi:hypothetical protein
MSNEKTPEVEVKTTSTANKVVNVAADTICVAQAVLVVRKVVLAGLKAIRNYR